MKICSGMTVQRRPRIGSVVEGAATPLLEFPKL